MTPPPVPARDPDGGSYPATGRPMEPGADSRARGWSPACDDISLSLANPHNGPVSAWSMSLGDMELAWQAFEAWLAEHERRKGQA